MGTGRLSVRGRLGRSTALGTHGRTDAAAASSALAFSPGDIDARRLGTDLLVPEDPDDTIPVTPTGDLPLLSGRPNLRAALRRRLLAAPGQLVHRPDYGGGLPLYLERLNSPTRQAQLANQARANLLRDPRLAEAAVTVGLGAPGASSRTQAVTVSTTYQVRDDVGETLTLPATE